MHFFSPFLVEVNPGLMTYHAQMLDLQRERGFKVILGKSPFLLLSLDCRAQMSRRTLSGFLNWHFLHFLFPQWNGPSSM
jgi:hypothetical protein